MLYEVITRIEGVGEKFGGLYRVTSVTQSLDAGGWRTAFEVRKEIWFGSIPLPEHRITSYNVCYTKLLRIAACRVIGLPCRYVSGYLAAGQGDVATHAWAEAFVSDLGWVSFDVANRQSATDAYVRLAVGPDYSAVAPVIGVRTGGGGEEISVAVTVQQVQ